MTWASKSVLEWMSKNKEGTSARMFNGKDMDDYAKFHNTSQDDTISTMRSCLNCKFSEFDAEYPNVKVCKKILEIISLRDEQRTDDYIVVDIDFYCSLHHYVYLK